MAEDAVRPYNSPLRESQALRTRTLILDTFTELLADRRADEITTKDIAARAGVSQPTVYRHFADREALLEGLTARMNEVMGVGVPLIGDLDEAGALFERLFVTSDAFAVEVTAEVLLNADPRSFAPETRWHSAELLERVAEAFPELDDPRHRQIAGLLRCLGSSHSWLRMREEFGVPGVESGPLVHWAMDLIIAAIRRGDLPDSRPAPEADGA